MQTTNSLLVLALLSSTASAAPIHGDVEVDPTAYALSGNSIHAGIGYAHWRLDLGNFGLAVPQFVHGDDGFDVAFDGYGAKLHWYWRDDQTGPFVGAGASLVRVHVHLQGTDLRADDRQLGTGIEVGYRIALPAGFYVTPWIGVGYNFSVDSVMLGGKTFDPDPVTVFPAVHVGYRFQ
jgi:hypothetical protein